jgi:hypothetical protein
MFRTIVPGAFMQHSYGIASFGHVSYEGTGDESRVVLRASSVAKTALTTRIRTGSGRAFGRDRPNIRDDIKSLDLDRGLSIP